MDRTCMDKTVIYTFLIYNIVYCNGVSLQEQLEHILKTKRESLGLDNGTPIQTRRTVEFNAVMGAPSRFSHLPEAETILPGHTLIKPALGMLKSSIKYPHKDFPHVYGNYDNLGITYNSKSSRLLYSGFRRAFSDYIMIAPVNAQDSRKPKVVLTAVVLDLDKDDNARDRIMRLYHSLLRRAGKKKRKKQPKISYKSLDLNKIFPADSGSSEKERKAGLKQRIPMTVAKHGNDLSEMANDMKLGQLLRQKVKGEENLEPIYPETEKSEESTEFLTDNNDQPTPAVSEERSRNLTKLELLYKTKDMYNHIRINPEAPLHEDILPKYNVSDSILSSDLRDWWFFHQDDFQSLEAANNGD